MASPPAKHPASSRIPNFFRMNVRERLAALHDHGYLSHQDVAQLGRANPLLELNVADKMIENVLGVFGLPMGVALNFMINNRDYVIPLVVEEPSIVAGLSGAARIARQTGGYTASSSEPILIGQVQVMLERDPESAMQRLLENKTEILALANSFNPNMVARGGGAKDIEVFHYLAQNDGRHMVVLHLLVNTCDAMGANLVNTLCEGIASLVEKITGGKVFLRILSNLTDRAISKASVHIPTAHLQAKDYSGEQVRDGIILANDLALADPYRATTHNKGIMNGVDAVAIATGNDWRAIEAAAHAYAARSGRYQALTQWSKNENGDLVGAIEIPLKVGTVGGSLQSNPNVRINHHLLGSPNATELASIMAAVGLAQNFAALRSLSTNGIQKNHMNHHARSVASSAGVSEDYFDRVVDELIESGEIKVWKAKEIAENLIRKKSPTRTAKRHAACGKIILLGEHAVVYGHPAIALPIPLAVEAAVEPANKAVTLQVPQWQLEQTIELGAPGLAGTLAKILQQLNLHNTNMTIEVFPHVPRAMGLGGSAATAVAILRALNHRFSLALNDETINNLAFEFERGAHGTPSGVDNTVATYGIPMHYQRTNDQAEFKPLTLTRPLNLVIGVTGQSSLTAETVTRVRQARQKAPMRYENIFDQITALTRAGVESMAQGQLAELGEIMNLCHGYLNALQLCTPELELLTHIARANGALGAKLTGGGGGGSMIALCADNSAEIVQAIRGAGYAALQVTVDASTR